MEKIAIFASGSGTNAQRIIEYFNGNPSVSVDLVLSNNPEAFVLTRAITEGIPAIVFSRKEFYESDKVLTIPEILLPPDCSAEITLRAGDCSSKMRSPSSSFFDLMLINASS